MATPPRAKKAPEESASIPAEGAVATVRSQALFRLVNEETSRFAASLAVGEEFELVCECGQSDCFARIAVAPDDYEAVRSFPTRFLITPEHAGGDERIVAESAGYAVVEKLGRSAAAAILLDPREQPPCEEAK